MTRNPYKITISALYGRDGKQSRKREGCGSRKFAANLISRRKNPDRSYHDGGFLQEILVTIIDKASIEIMLQNRIPRTAQQLTHNIANGIPEKPKATSSG